jgi:hypothetical protein
MAFVYRELQEIEVFGIFLGRTLVNEKDVCGEQNIVGEI